MSSPAVPPARRATIVTLSRDAGVAPSTISRALKGDPRISPETRARIARLAKESGYTPHASARTMSSGRSGLIGIVIGPAQNLLYTELLHEAVRQAGQRGKRLLMIHAGSGPIEDRTADTLLQYEVDGCLIASAELPSHVAAVCKANGVPVVMVNRVARLHASAVACDNHAGGMLVAELLLGAGHHRIGLVRTSSSTSPGQERDRGFTDRLAAAGLQPVLRLDARSTYDGGFAAGQQIVALRAAERPTALFVVSDIMAFGVLQAFAQGGVRVPNESRRDRLRRPAAIGLGSARPDDYRAASPRDAWPRARLAGRAHRRAGYAGRDGDAAWPAGPERFLGRAAGTTVTIRIKPKHSCGSTTAALQWTCAMPTAASRPDRSRSTGPGIRTPMTNSA